MRYLYRHYRANSTDSIESVVLCESIDAVKRVVIENFSKSGHAITKDDIVIGDDFVVDTTTGWLNARRVCVTCLGENDLGTPQCVGMCCDEAHLPEGMAGMIEGHLETENPATYSIRGI